MVIFQMNSYQWYLRLDNFIGKVCKSLFLGSLHFSLLYYFYKDIPLIRQFPEML